MKSKKAKILSVLFLCVMFCLCFTGCSGESDGKTITTNAMNSTMTLSGVNYYDFYSDIYVGNYSGTCSVMSNTLNSTEIWFTDAQSVTRVACVNTPLSQRPATVNVYTNSAKSTYDTYTCKY
ncbi:MAG: hypothetical protein NC398_07055 [Acetatifactor muris]|nr:hypothetical protein [Acetatifactor muris]MCM1525695.1 hypothetical protein [Bacteroides sp.]